MHIHEIMPFSELPPQGGDHTTLYAYGYSKLFGFPLVFEAAYVLPEKGLNYTSNAQGWHIIYRDTADHGRMKSTPYWRRIVEIDDIAFYGWGLKPDAPTVTTQDISDEVHDRLGIMTQERLRLSEQRRLYAKVESLIAHAPSGHTEPENDLIMAVSVLKSYVAKNRMLEHALSACVEALRMGEYDYLTTIHGYKNFSEKSQQALTMASVLSSGGEHVQG